MSNVDYLREVERLCAEVARLTAQGQADQRALHDALCWAHEMHGKSLPVPSRAVAALIERVAELEGLRPEFPPMPPSGAGLPRYGLRWSGPQTPLAVPMDDGYWTPWHLAQAEVARLRESEAGLRAAAQEILSLARDTSGWCECNDGPMCIARTKAAAALSAPALEPSAEAREREFASKLYARVEALEGALTDLCEQVRAGGPFDMLRARALLSTTPTKPAPRPDATEALRVATEALEGLLSHLGEPMNPEDLSAHDFDCIADFEQARALVAAENRARAALDLLRAHVEPTPLETAVQAHAEEAKP